MTPTGLEVASKSFIDFNCCFVHCGFLDGLAGNVNIIVNDKAKHLLRNDSRLLLRCIETEIEQFCDVCTYLRKAELCQDDSQMTAKIASQGLLARHLRKATSQLLAHQPTGLTQFVFALLGHVIFEDELARRNARDGNRTLNDRDDNLNSHA